MKSRKLLVLGATGQTGTLVVERAIAAGHEVRALVRNRSKLPAGSAVDAVIGEVTDPSQLRSALEGCDAVIMTLGHPQSWYSLFVGVLKQRHLLRDVSVALTKAMPQAEVRRLVAISACGAGSSFVHVPLWFQVMIRFTGIRQPYKDHGDQEVVIKASGLDWTLIRPVRLMEGPPSGKLEVSFDTAPSEYEVSRENVAAYCVGCLQKDDTIHKSAMLSETRR